MDLTVNDLVQLALFMLLDENESSAFDIECLQMYFHKCLLVIVFRCLFSGKFVGGNKYRLLQFCHVRAVTYLIL